MEFTPMKREKVPCFFLKNKMAPIVSEEYPFKIPSRKMILNTFNCPQDKPLQSFLRYPISYAENVKYCTMPVKKCIIYWLITNQLVSNLVFHVGIFKEVTNYFHETPFGGLYQYYCPWNERFNKG